MKGLRPGLGRRRLNDLPFFRSPLPPGTLRHLTAAVKRQYKRYRKALKECQEKFSSSAVHDSRVETRRLSSMVELLSPFLKARSVDKVQRALKVHLDTFNDLRDTQVLLVAADKLRDRFPVANAFYSFLREREERFSRKTRKNIKQVKTRRVAKILAGCRETLKQWRKARSSREANELLLRTIRAAFEQTQQLQRQIEPQDTDTIHRTRVAFKKFRYMVETLAAYVPLKDTQLPGRMHDYQTLMGDIQDTEVLRRTLQKYLDKHQHAPGPGQRLQEAILRRRRRLIDTYLQAADELAEFWPNSTGAEGWPCAKPDIRNPKSQIGNKSKQNAARKLQKPGQKHLFPAGGRNGQ